MGKKWMGKKLWTVHPFRGGRPAYSEAKEFHRIKSSSSDH